MSGSIIQATSAHLELLTPLFDSYRVFYGRQSDPAQAKQFLAERLANNDSVIFLAVDETSDHGLGFAQLYPSFSSVAMRRVWILNDLFVVEQARRRGTGRALLDMANAFGAQSDAVRIDLATAKDNLAAKSLYESSGYRPDTQFDHYKFPVT